MANWCGMKRPSGEMPAVHDTIPCPPPDMPIEADEWAGEDLDDDGPGVAQ